MILWSRRCIDFFFFTNVTVVKTCEIGVVKNSHKEQTQTSCDLSLPLRLQDLNKRQGLALLTKVGESVKHVAGGYKLKVRPAEFYAMGEYLDTFSQKLGTIDRIAQRILKEQSGDDDDDDILISSIFIP